MKITSDNGMVITGVNNTAPNDFFVTKTDALGKTCISGIIPTYNITPFTPSFTTGGNLLAMLSMTTVNYPMTNINSGSLTNYCTNCQSFSGNALSNSPLCSGATLTLNSSGGTSYLWSGPLGYTSTTNNNSLPTVNTNNEGIYSIQISNGTGCTDLIYLDVEIDSCLNYSTNTTPNYFEIFPNPSHNVFTIESDAPIGGIILHSVTGTIVLHESGIISQKASFDIKGIAPGTYILNTSTGIRRKVIITK
jgi:hypothetical protein